MGNKPWNFKDLIGKKFGRLIVIKRIENEKKGNTRWLCKCDCGNIKKALGWHLNAGHTKSCGCLQKERASKAGKTHGHRSNRCISKTYNTWVHLHQRCNNPNNKDYKYYGGRGITICDRWSKFENFLADMGKAPRDLTLDRKNNYGNYEPDNCRWTTRIKQSRNSRQTKLNSIRVKNIKQCLKKGYLTQVTLGYIFGVSSSNINKIAIGKTWVDVAI